MFQLYSQKAQILPSYHKNLRKQSRTLFTSIQQLETLTGSKLVPQPQKQGSQALFRLGYERKGQLAGLSVRPVMLSQ